MDGGRLTFGLLCSGPPATARKRESQEEDIKEGRESGTGEDGGVETLVKGKTEERKEVETIQEGRDEDGEEN